MILRSLEVLLIILIILIIIINQEKDQRIQIKKILLKIIHNKMKMRQNVRKF